MVRRGLSATAEIVISQYFSQYNGFVSRDTRITTISWFHMEILDERYLWDG